MKATDQVISELVKPIRPVKTKPGTDSPRGQAANNSTATSWLAPPALNLSADKAGDDGHVKHATQQDSAVVSKGAALRPRRTQHSHKPRLSAKQCPKGRKSRPDLRRNPNASRLDFQLTPQGERGMPM